MNIEFCGLPGCGKSYIIHRLMPLVSSRYNVIKLCSDREKKGFVTKKILGIKRRIKIKSSSVAMEKSALDAYIQNHLIDSRSSLFYRILLEEIYEIKKIENKCDLIFGNEGVIQSLSSLSHRSLFDAEINQVINVINECFYANVKTLIFNCFVDEGTNIKRILSRNRKDDRFINEDINIISTLLSIKKYNIEYLLNRLSNVRVVMVDLKNSDIAIQTVVNILKEYGYELHEQNLS